jgi:hypothetical protein
MFIVAFRLEKFGRQKSAAGGPQRSCSLRLACCASSDWHSVDRLPYPIII